MAVHSIPRYFADVDIETSLGHPSHASLGVTGLELVEEVNKRRLIRNLQILDCTVTLYIYIW